jgi:hypothetical protein
MIDAAGAQPSPSPRERPRTVDDAANALRERLGIEGARLSYRQNCESMQRIHVSPALGTRRVDAVTTEDIERLARAMLARGLAPKTVRNTMTFLHSVFALGVKKGWRRRTRSPMLPALGAGGRPMRARTSSSSPRRSSAP